MNALLQTGSSLSACGHAQAGGRVPVPPEKRFLINFSGMLSSLAADGKSRVSFVIGSSYGLDGSVKERADLLLSFSQMTFPHQLMRVLLAEQLYRACHIGKGGKYHK